MYCHDWLLMSCVGHIFFSKKLFHLGKDKVFSGIQENVACARGLCCQDLKMFFISSGLAGKK